VPSQPASLKNRVRVKAGAKSRMPRGTGPSRSPRQIHHFTPDWFISVAHNACRLRCANAKAKYFVLTRLPAVAEPGPRTKSLRLFFNSTPPKSPFFHARPLSFSQKSSVVLYRLYQRNTDSGEAFHSSQGGMPAADLMPGVQATA